MFLGVYHHPPPSDLQAQGVIGVEVGDTWLNEAAAFLSAYVAKSAVLVRKLP